ncbi:unnamed protein product [Cyprideis torosa]|uniref:Large ribosomal subunit protein eL28 n=1 Tax=Cyprideis torosa TaxID=163714 RepID=A0A7R8WDQ7_9CRUS|nr:unnamed protein product [Cyprideis torosa]CAG0893457.1 unnamed protein product [Cyprideis torosa]
MSAFLQWEIIKNHHSQLLKRPNVRPLSAEKFNVRNIHGMKANGYINQKAIHIAPGKDNKGVVMTTKKSKNVNHPGIQLSSNTMTAGPRRLLWKMARSIKKTGYRKDLKKSCLRRASAILKSQRPGGAVSKRKRRRGAASKKPRVSTA